MTRLVWMLLLGPACALAQTVDGHVFDAATGAVVAGVKVELLKSTTPFHETATDGGGRFHFEVPEGDYSIRYQSPDYWLTAGPTDYRPFHVGPGSPVKLEARLMPWSKISGRVVDPRGNGVPKLRLQLTGSGMTINGRTYVRSSTGGGGGGQLSDSPLRLGVSAATDSEGRFEAQVMPGSYTLSVLPPPDLKPPVAESDGPALAWKRTYYPGVTFPEGASKIVALPGGEVSGVEFKLATVPVHAVRGVVLNPDGTAAAGATVRLGDGFPQVSMQSKSDGAFEFSAVAEGRQPLSADAEKGPVKLRAVQWVEVGRHDVENVRVRLAAPVTVRGRTIVEAREGAPALRSGSLILALSGDTREDNDLAFIAGAPIAPNANGEFTVEVLPGPYRIGPRLQPPPPPYYLDAVRSGGIDLLVQTAELRADSEIAIVYKSDGGSVVGKAEDCASGGVLLVPANPAMQHRGFSRSGPCDSKDRYEVAAVRPGDYYALAFAGNSLVLDIDEALLKQAVRVSVRSGEVTSADLRTVTRPVY